MATSNIAAGMYGVGAISSAFSSYMSGQMQKLAYQHEAAVAELNANQIEINAQFVMAEKYSQLADTLATQNVIAAATGRAGGSIESVAQSSIADVKKEENIVRLTGEAQSVATMMDAASSRAAGNTAASMGLLNGVNSLITGGTKAAGYLS